METQFDLGEQPFTLTARERAAAGVATLSDAVEADEEIRYAGLVTQAWRAGVLIVTPRRLLWCGAGGRGLRELTPLDEDGEPIVVAMRRRRNGRGGDVITVGEGWTLSNWEGDNLPDTLRAWAHGWTATPRADAGDDEGAADDTPAALVDPFAVVWRRLDAAGETGVPALVHTTLAPIGYVRLDDDTVMAARATDDEPLEIGAAIHVRRIPDEPLLIPTTPTLETAQP
jgi:hypothetical protein